MPIIKQTPSWLLILLMQGIVFCVSISTAYAVPMTNQLKGNPSAYLAMHGNDPVAWQEWNEATLARARAENKLLFVSIGYFSCHWCHVMQRESYSDAKVAGLLNQGFIPVKVDRELLPALDAYLIDFVQRTQGHAGWPLNVFLTPDGNPVVGMVYIPTQQFRSLLAQLTELWKKDSASMGKMAAQAAAAARDTTPIKSDTLAPDEGLRLLETLQNQALQYGDDLAGGFGSGAKFPMAAQLSALLASLDAKPNPALAAFLQLTLTQMATQGLRDHIGGGFFRYTVDPAWQAPHFEKMLYTNADLVPIYLQAAKRFARPDLKAIATETLDFMLRELQGPDGGMMASLSAVDHAGVEGGYYLWSTTELQRLLNKNQFAAVQSLWHLDEATRFEAGYLAFYARTPEAAAKQLELPLDKLMQQLAAAQSILFKARQSRQVPIDSKRLTAWNALALSAFAAGFAATGDERYRKAAQAVRNFLVDQLWDGKLLYRARGEGQLLGRAGLEDYAYAAQGLLDWFDVNHFAKDRELATRWVDIAWQRFFTPTGWRLSDAMLLPNQTLGSALLEDSALQSPSTALLQVSLRLIQADPASVLKARLAGAIGLGLKSVQDEPYNYAGQAILISRYQSH